MALDYISDTITREEFYEKIHSKSGSASAVETAKAHITNLDYFSKDKYWEYHDMLFENQGVWNKVETASAITIFKEFAVELELNQEQFNSCLDSGKYIEEISNDLKDGRNYGVTGTPGFFIGNEEIGFVKLNGAQPFEAFKSVIDSQLR